MAVQPGTQFEQLPMFMKPSEIMDTRDNWDEVEHETGFGRTEITSDPEVVWDKKLQSAKASGLADSIKKEGVKNPVTLSKDFVMNGHHRVISAYHYAPDKWVPVRHMENPYDNRD